VLVLGIALGASVAAPGQAKVSQPDLSGVYTGKERDLRRSNSNQLWRSHDAESFGSGRVRGLVLISITIYRSVVREREFSEKAAYVIEHHITRILKHGADPNKVPGSKDLYDALQSVVAYSDYMDPDLAPSIWGSLLHRNMYQVSRYIKAYKSSVARLVFNPEQAHPLDWERLSELVDNWKVVFWQKVDGIRIYQDKPLQADISRDGQLTYALGRRRPLLYASFYPVRPSEEAWRALSSGKGFGFTAIHGAPAPQAINDLRSPEWSCVTFRLT
jgi:hypothetical protein